MLEEFKLFVNQDKPTRREHTAIDVRHYRRQGTTEFIIDNASKRDGAKRWHSKMIIFNLDNDQIDNLCRFLQGCKK